MSLLPQSVATSGGERRSDWSKYTANCLLIQIQKIIKIWCCVKEKNKGSDDWIHIKAIFGC